MEINKLKKIEELNKEVPLFLIDNYFDLKLYQELNSTYPTKYILEKIRSSNSKSASLNFTNKNDENFLKKFLSHNNSWKNICDYYLSDKFKFDVREFINKISLPFENRRIKNFNINNTKTTINFTCSKSGFQLEPHTDAKQKIISLIIYFPENNWNKEWTAGTQFYKPNNLSLAKKFVKKMSFGRLERLIPFCLLPLRNTHIIKGHENEFHNAFSKYKYINYSSNKLVGFIKTNYTFHSVPEIKCAEEVLRKTLLINLNFK